MNEYWWEFSILMRIFWNFYETLICQVMTLKSSDSKSSDGKSSDGIKVKWWDESQVMGWKSSRLLESQNEMKIFFANRKISRFLKKTRKCGRFFVDGWKTTRNWTKYF